MHGSISYRTYNGSRRDREDWLEICKNGLVADNADVEAEFASCFTSREDFTNDDLYLVFDGEEAVATVCGICQSKDNMGNVHMVSVKASARGKGLGKYINEIVKAHLSRDNCEFAYLTTDEWRVAAVRSYLSAGFLPVKYGKGMTQRWRKWLTENGYKNIPLLNARGERIKLLCND